jgi:hypothetical protein
VQRRLRHELIAPKTGGAHCMPSALSINEYEHLKRSPKRVNYFDPLELKFEMKLEDTNSNFTIRGTHDTTFHEIKLLMFRQVPVRFSMHSKRQKSFACALT